MKWKYFYQNALILSIAIVFTVLNATVPSGVAQERARMDPYRTLARLIDEECQKGNYAKAAELAHILEETWDKGEGGGGSQSLRRINGVAYRDTDKAMDDFIEPIVRYSEKKPDQAAVQIAYKHLIDEYKESDSAPVLAGPKIVHLSSEALQAFTGKYQYEGSRKGPIAITMNDEGLLVDSGTGDEKQQLLPFSATEFFLEEDVAIHIAFSKDENGNVTGGVMTGTKAPRKLKKVS